MTVIKLEHQELRIRSWFNWWDASKYLGLNSAYVGVGNVFILHLCNLKKKKKEKRWFRNAIMLLQRINH